MMTMTREEKMGLGTRTIQAFHSLKANGLAMNKNMKMTIWAV